MTQCHQRNGAKGLRGHARRVACEEAQEKGDPMLALTTLKQAFTTDVTAILATARERAGGAIDPLHTFRASGYRQQKASERHAEIRTLVGIV